MDDTWIQCSALGHHVLKPLTTLLISNIIYPEQWRSTSSKQKIMVLMQESVWAVLLLSLKSDTACDCGEFEKQKHLGKRKDESIIIFFSQQEWNRFFQNKTKQRKCHFSVKLNVHFPASFCVPGCWVGGTQNHLYKWLRNILPYFTNCVILKIVYKIDWSR